MKSKDKPTSLDIAHLAGVSQPTVSRALRNSPLVSQQTQRKVQEIAQKLNYKVDVNARNLRSQRTNTLALLIFEDVDGDAAFINPFFLSLLGSITRASAKAGYDLLFSFQQLSQDWNAEYEDANKADGIIFLGYGDYTRYMKRIIKLDSQGAHFVTWGPVIKNQPGLFIGCNNIQGGRLATEHLLEHGHKDIAFLGDLSEENPEFKERYKGYLKAHKKYDIAPSKELVFGATSCEEQGFQAAMELLSSKQKFTAISCASDLIAIGAIKALRANGIRVPNDVAVVGFDDIPIAEHISPSLTTIKQDTDEAGKELVNSVVSLIDGEQIKSKLLPTRLIVRESCGAGLRKESK